MYPPIETSRGIVEGAAAGTAGLIGGVLLGAGYVAARKLDTEPVAQDETKRDDAGGGA